MTKHRGPLLIAASTNIHAALWSGHETIGRVPRGLRRQDSTKGRQNHRQPLFSRQPGAAHEDEAMIASAGCGHLQTRPAARGYVASHNQTKNAPAPNSIRTKTTFPRCHRPSTHWAQRICPSFPDAFSAVFRVCGPSRYSGEPVPARVHHQSWHSVNFVARIFRSHVEKAHRICRAIQTLNIDDSPHPASHQRNHDAIRNDPHPGVCSDFILARAGVSLQKLTFAC